MYISVRAIKDHDSGHCDNGGMAEGQVACVICNTRRPRRFCPGVAGDICPVCCGTERENTVNCPLECPYLREARLREPDPDVDPREFPNQDIRVDEQFLHRNEPLLLFLASGLATAALRDKSHAIDLDVREALAALVSTYRALQSGLYYNVKPDNPIAGRILEAVQNRIREIDEVLKKNNSVLRDSDVLGVLAFLQRLEIQKNNRRRKSRAFIDFLREFFPPEPPPDPEQPKSSLILP
jgi:hypothetical protein